MRSALYGRTPPPLSLVACLALSLTVAACATTRQTRSVEESGFLGDYSELREGGKGEAQLVYIDADADFSIYKAVLIDSVTLWHDSDLSKIPVEDRQALTDYLYKALHKELGKDYEIVESPGVGVLRVRAAITEAKGARVLGNVITSVVPQLRMLSTLGGLASDTQVFVGKCGIEAEVTDSLTNYRLAAAVDERAGTKALRGGVGKWSDVEQAFDFWAARLRERLETLRQR
jgi:hypothetical protein